MGKITGSESRIFDLDLGSPDLGLVADVHAAVTDDGTEQTITTGFTDPPTPRVLTATSGGTTTDIKAIQVTVNGTDEFDAVLQEVLPVFTVNTATTVTGSKVFKTITSMVIPAHDGTEATTSLGSGDTLGLGILLTRNSVLGTFFGGVRESTLPTVNFNAADIESNSILLDSALDGSAVLVDYYEPSPV